MDKTESEIVSQNIVSVEEPSTVDGCVSGERVVKPDDVDEVPQFARIGPTVEVDARAPAELSTPSSSRKSQDDQPSADDSNFVSAELAEVEADRSLLRKKDVGAHKEPSAESGVHDEHDGALTEELQHQHRYSIIVTCDNVVGEGG